MEIHNQVKVIKKGHKHEGKAGVIVGRDPDQDPAAASVTVKLDLEPTPILIKEADLQVLTA